MNPPGYYAGCTPEMVSDMVDLGFEICSGVRCRHCNDPPRMNAWSFTRTDDSLAHAIIAPERPESLGINFVCKCKRVHLGVRLPERANPSPQSAKSWSSEDSFAVRKILEFLPRLNEPVRVARAAAPAVSDSVTDTLAGSTGERVASTPRTAPRTR